MYTDLNDFVNGEHDPDIFYFFIQQSNEDAKKSLDIIVPEEKKYKIELTQKIDIFRAVMQYIEEFGIYFLSNTKNEVNLSDSIIKKDPKDVRDETFYKFNNNYHEDFAKDLDYTSYDELLKDVFKIPNSSPELETITINNLKKILDDISWFFIFYSDLYNAIKHGYRIFIQNFSHFEIQDDDGNKYVIELSEDYFNAICKEHIGGNKYVLIYPLKALIENSLKILEDTREIFNYLRRTNKYDDELSFFEYESLNYFLIYTKSGNELYTIYLPKAEKLEEKLGSEIHLEHAKILLKANRIEFYINDINSIEYPFDIKFGPDYGDHPKPGIKCDLKISSYPEMDISQFYTLLKINDLTNNEFKVICIDEKTGEEIFKNKFGEIEFPEIKSVISDDIIALLFKLKIITQEIIPVPFYLSEEQKNLLLAKVGYNFTRADAKNLLNELKLNKPDLALFKIRILDSEGNIIENTDLGATEKMNIFDMGEEGTSVKLNFQEMVDKTYKILDNFELFLKEIESSIKDVSEYLVTDKYDNSFGMIIQVKLNEAYWYKEYIVQLTLKLKENDE